MASAMVFWARRPFAPWHPGCEGCASQSFCSLAVFAERDDQKWVKTSWGRNRRQFCWGFECFFLIGCVFGAKRYVLFGMVVDRSHGRFERLCDFLASSLVQRSSGGDMSHRRSPKSL